MLNINMSEFYYNLSSDQIKALIESKIFIYKQHNPDFRYLPYSDILIMPENLIHRALAHHYEKQGINLNDYNLYRYIGMADGENLYTFYNIINK